MSDILGPPTEGVKAPPESKQSAEIAGVAELVAQGFLSAMQATDARLVDNQRAIYEGLHELADSWLRLALRSDAPGHAFLTCADQLRLSLPPRGDA